MSDEDTEEKSCDYITNGKGTHEISWEYSCDM